MSENNWPLPKIDPERCDACGACVDACPEQALKMSGGKPVFSSPQNCTYCTDCEAVCPSGAIDCPLEITWSN